MIYCKLFTIQKKPTICGTKATNVLDKFFSRQTLIWINWIFWCICNYYDFITPTNSKCCSICYRLAVKSASFEIPNFRGLGECWRIGICTNGKPTHDFPIPLNTQFWSICRHLVTFPVSGYGRQLDPRFGLLGWILGVENGTYRDVVPTFLFDFCTYSRPILHRLVTIRNVIDRQSDQNRPPKL